MKPSKVKMVNKKSFIAKASRLKGIVRKIGIKPIRKPKKK